MSTTRPAPRGAPAPTERPELPVNLTIALCDAAKKDAAGTFSAMGLGVTKLNVPSFPGGWQGGLIMIVQLDDPGTFPFTLELKSPQNAAWSAFGGGEIIVHVGGEQMIGALPFPIAVPVPGVYTVRMTVGETSAHVNFTAVAIPEDS